MKRILKKMPVVAVLLVGLLITSCEDEINGRGHGKSFIAGRSVVTVNGVSFGMIKVKGGTFQMGAPDSDTVAYNLEKPQHIVTLGDFYIAETEVTQELWQAVMGSNPSYYNTKGADYPVENVTWYDCDDFINRLNALTGKRFRMPTEAEWEYAARGGRNSRGYRYSGSNCLDDVAWYWKNSGDRYLQGNDSDWKWDTVMNNNCCTHPVRSKASNEIGLYDMNGNVWEWCNDWCSTYTADAEKNPRGADSGSVRVVRGGGWYDFERNSRVSQRGKHNPDYHSNCFGLRIAL